ncbi:hypothetical protein NLI96_g5826 [Meripilus lineatus]|uniref:Uncharacterized protein n=1 Tax=Meripilus lineatus TaxID=2056292 RepID=A0AAD5V268_9APHY|nr:hypothetical protein NLI96_g5826 [Physisporinus lineatus]
MSSLMTLRFMDRIYNPGIITLADRIEATFASSPPSYVPGHKIGQPEAPDSAPVGPLVHNLVFSAEKSRALATVGSLRLAVHKYEMRIEEKDGDIGTLEANLSASQKKCKALSDQLCDAQEKERILDLELIVSQEKCKILSVQLSESQGKEQAASCFAKDTQDRLETVEEDLDETYAELAELKITLRNERAARRTLQELADTEAKQHQSRIDVLRAECSTTRNELSYTQKDLEKAREDSADLQRDLDDKNEHLCAERAEVVSGLQAELAAALDEQNCLKDRLEAEVSGRRELRSLVASSHEEIAKLKTRIEEQKEAFAQAQDKLKADKDYTELEATLGNAKGELACVHTLVTGLQSNLGSTEAELEEARSRVSEQKAELDKNAKECDKWRRRLVTYNARTKEGFKSKDAQITEVRTQLALKQKELDEAHNDWHIDKEESDWVKKRWEEAREDLEAANTDINALHGEVDQKDAMIADTRRELESLQEEFRAYRQKVEEDAQRQREHIETVYKGLDESSEEVENCYVEISDTLLKLDVAEDKANFLCAQVEEKDTTIQTLQARLDQADDDLKVAKDGHALEISTLTSQLVEKDSMLSVTRTTLDDTKADLEAANTTVSTLFAELSDKNTALSEAQAELTETEVALKVAEDKLCAEEAAHQDSVVFADAKTLELSRELVQHDQLIAHLTECEEAALKDVARLEATNKDLRDHILTLEAQLSSTPSAPSSDLILSVDETSSDLEDALAKNAVLEATTKATEVINADLTRAFGQECDAHDATRKDVQSLRSRLAVALNDLKDANEKIESLHLQMESREVEYHALEQKVSEVVAEMSKENAQLGQSKKSIEELLVAKVDRCDRLEKENMTLRGSQSNLAILTGSPLSNVTNSSVPSPPVRAIQKKTGGSSWFNAGIFSPNASFRWSSRVSVSSPLASSSFSPSHAPLESPSILHNDPFGIENVVTSVPPHL